MRNQLKKMLILLFAMCFFTPQAAHANMAAPAESDIGSSITFEKNDEIAVLSEVLDITVNGSQADIVATYRMKNTTDQSISTSSIFLSPNMESSGVNVVVNGKAPKFTAEKYELTYDTQAKTNDWQYAALTNTVIAYYNLKQTVDAITFTMDFSPDEEYDVIVSYSYRLGGYPDYDFSVKKGVIDYYIAPAAMWKDFSSLTINLYLDEAMPIIKSSNLAFDKVDTRTYQYTSDTLPQENLKIVIDENWWQNIFSTLRSPYLGMMLLIYSPVILLVAPIVIFVVWRVYKEKKQKNQNLK